jgi:hypothetical protein
MEFGNELWPHEENGSLQAAQSNGRRPLEIPFGRLYSFPVQVTFLSFCNVYSLFSVVTLCLSIRLQNCAR